MRGSAEFNEDSRMSRLMLDAIAQAVIATDLLGTVTYWNAAARSLYGWSAQEAIGQHLAVLTAPDIASDVMAAILEALADGTSWRGEFSVQRRSGQRFPALAAQSGIYGDDGELVGMIGVSSDLTELKKEQRARLSSEGRMRKVLQNEINARVEAAEQSGKRELRWQSLVSHSADVAVIALPGSQEITYVSPAVTRLFGWQPEELIGRLGRTLVHPDDVHLLEAALLRIGADPNQYATVEFRLACSDGSFRWVEETISNLADEPGVYGVVANVRDISGRRKAEMALRASEARYRLIAETSEEGIWATDSHARTLYANQKMADLLGCPLADMYAYPSYDLISSGSRTLFESRMDDRRNTGAESYEVHHIRPDGSHRVLRMSVSPFVDEGRDLGLLAMVADVTTAREAERDLVYRATHDPLTGLANRTLLLGRLQQSLDRAASSVGGSVAVLVADIDQFKLINDSYGHQSGDDLLIEVSRRWERVLRPQDTVARLGGDEFVVMCDGAGALEAHCIAERLLQALEAPIRLGEQTIAVTASIGIALAATDDAATLLRFADAAMYEAKALGRGRMAVFSNGLIEQARNRLDLFNDLKAALEQGDLNLHYQPVVELATGELLGVEALCRWNHPERGAVSPAEFIAAAEENGLIERLDRWVVRRACRDGAAMRAQGVLPPSAYVAVNVSAGHLSLPGFEGGVSDALAASGLPPQALVLEVTESAVMRDPDTAQRVLGRLQALGVAVAIDDFGTGYSSLAYLRRFPVAALKIDRSFVQHLTVGADDRAIVTAVVDLARAFNVSTTAEGIETAAELALLQELGCRAGQGFLWSPAIPREKLAVLMSELSDGRFPVGLAEAEDVAAIPSPRGLTAELSAVGSPGPAGSRALSTSLAARSPERTAPFR